ncbi:hypothetical protein PAMP_011150 [Pampus punctatissimus]
MFSDTLSPSLTNHTQLTHMQSFNQIAHSGDKRSGKNRVRGGGGALNLWLTESCEGTLKSPKSFKLGHVALASVTSMLRNNADATELEAGEEISQKSELWLVTTVAKTLSHLKCQ